MAWLCEGTEVCVSVVYNPLLVSSNRGQGTLRLYGVERMIGKYVKIHAPGYAVAEMKNLVLVFDKYNYSCQNKIVCKGVKGYTGVG